MRLQRSRIAEKVVFLYIAHFGYIAHGQSARYIASRLYMTSLYLDPAPHYESRCGTDLELAGEAIIFLERFGEL